MYFPCEQRGLTAPFVDDGLLEVVGFRDAWQGTVLFTPNGHGVRLAQVGCVTFYDVLRYIVFLFLTVGVLSEGLATRAGCFMEISTCKEGIA